jgi:hypothetical protein
MRHDDTCWQAFCDAMDATRREQAALRRLLEAERAAAAALVRAHLEALKVKVKVRTRA